MYHCNPLIFSLGGQQQYNNEFLSQLQAQSLSKSDDTALFQNLPPCMISHWTLPLPNNIQMGQQQSNLKDEIKSKYTIVKTISPGEYLVKAKKKSAELQLRVLNFLVQDEMVHYTNLLQKRKKIKNPHLLELIEYNKVVDQLMCSSTFKLKIVSELPFKTIKEDIRERRERSPVNFFSEDQLWSILYSCCHALYSLYINKFSHESLTTDQIYIDTDGIIKVADSLLVNGSKNYLCLMNEELKQEDVRYISPQLRNLVDDNNFYQYEKEKSDVFILGMIILQISNLSPLRYYDVKTKRFQFDCVITAFKEFKSRYSQKFYEIVSRMLTTDYNTRPNFEEIIESIEEKTIHTNSNLSSKDSSIIHDTKDYNPMNNGNLLIKPLELNQVKEKLNFDAKPNNYVPSSNPQGLTFNSLLTYKPQQVNSIIIPQPPVFATYNPPYNPPQPQPLPQPLPQQLAKVFDFSGKQFQPKAFDWKFDTISKQKKQEHSNYTPYQQLMNLSGNATIPSNTNHIIKPETPYIQFNIPITNNIPPSDNQNNQGNFMKERRFSQLKFGGIELAPIQSTSAHTTQKKEITIPQRMQSFTQVKGAQLFKKDRTDQQAVIDKGTFVIEENANGRYQGFKQNNQKHGIGRFTYTDNGSYQGQWKNDRMDGYGKLYYPSGKIAYEGYWLQDQFHGTGRVYNEIQQRKTDSQGIDYMNFSIIEDKWVYFQGEFQRDQRNGKGMIKFITGQKFVGTFRYDVIEGEGAFYKRDGDVVYGVWHENLFVSP